MDKYLRLDFWEQYPEVVVWPIKNYNYLPAFEVSEVLKEYGLGLSDKIYECDKTQLMFTEIRDTETMEVEQSTTTLFIPLELLMDYLEQNPKREIPP